MTYCDTCKHDLWNNPEVCGKCVGSTTLNRKPRMYEPKQADTPQTDCETCRYGQDKHRYAHICNECGVGINNYTPQNERSDT